MLIIASQKKHLFNELMMVMPVFWHTNSLI